MLLNTEGLLRARGSLGGEERKEEAWVQGRRQSSTRGTIVTNTRDTDGISRQCVVSVWSGRGLLRD